VPYSHFVDAVGIDEPVSWTIVDGEMPPGLALNPTTGDVTGTPLLAGEFSVTVEVGDSVGGVAQSEYRIRISAD